MATDFLDSIIRQVEYYKVLGEKALARIPDETLGWQYNPASNSASTIVRHLWGNMLSRWTDFLTTDGEKPWRDRDAEFENDPLSREQVRQKWEEGWGVFLQALRQLREEDLDRVVYIRNQGHTVRDAINRQLAHYPYHVGQLVFLGKMLAPEWVSLSIPKGESKRFNDEKFSAPPRAVHYTDEFLKKT
jgi:hypothetical protein